jgi:hypothetical protein
MKLLFCHFHLSSRNILIKKLPQVLVLFAILSYNPEHSLVYIIYLEENVLQAPDMGDGSLFETDIPVY